MIYVRNSWSSIMAEEDIYGSGKKEVNILKWTGREENNRKYWEKRERKVSGQELTLWWYRRKDLYTHYLLKDNEMINQITMDIIKHAKDGETIYSLAKRIGFAYSAVYRWINVLESYDVLHVIRKGNKNIIKINKNEIYNRCTELNKSVGTMEKDKVFWNIIKKAHLEVRFVQSTAVVIWTQGSYITGDFTDRVYFLEVAEKDTDSLKELFKKHEIFFTEKDMIEE